MFLIKPLGARPLFRGYSMLCPSTTWHILPPLKSSKWVHELSEKCNFDPPGYLQFLEQLSKYKKIWPITVRKRHFVVYYVKGHTLPIRNCEFLIYIYCLFSQASFIEYFWKVQLFSLTTLDILKILWNSFNYSLSFLEIYLSSWISLNPNRYQKYQVQNYQKIL